MMGTSRRRQLGPSREGLGRRDHRLVDQLGVGDRGVTDHFLVGGV